jgi:hypothetical protein
MPTINQNQPWISRVLLDRFRLDAQPLEAFQVDTGEWVPKSVEAIARARERGVSFNRIIDPPRIASAGLKDVGNGELLYRVVSVDEYRRYIHSHVLPAAGHVPPFTRLPILAMGSQSDYDVLH